MARSLLLLLISCFPALLIGQSKSIAEIRESHKQVDKEREERVLEYLERTQKKLFYQAEDGTTIYLKDVVNGVPYYLKTDNAGARTTTGVDKLSEGGSLGLDLDGNDVLIGIWDGGRVRSSHQELSTRINPSDGAASDNFHATHVAGTILSKGEFNASSQGMAVNASAITFDFNNDDAEILARAGDEQEGVILSNHSYGTISGWRFDNGSWTWFGDPDVSEFEDYNFGYYNSNARLWDDITYNSPYYTIVKSAGNDRNDTGDGSRPADGPFDIISTAGTAKNIVTIGAVNKIGVYSSPADVVISSFSGWGPTDDGRIKPDFVAAGVGLFSTFESADDDYGTLSGTSMSAPNATGTFALIQQLHSKLNGGNFIKSAGLKALIAHTAYEAGTGDGPDYKFGWGLINGADAAEHLMTQNGRSRIIEEISLQNNQSYSISFTPVIGTNVKATICWTDLPGTTPPVSLDPEDLMLVNDLDMRLTSTSETNMPWILDPINPNNTATKGDNFRDNIEKVEFIASGEEYTLNVTHKGELESGSQSFYLVLTYDDGVEDVLYWVGDDGDFGEVGNWAKSSGGVSTGDTPSINTTIIFDNNSFSSDNVTINTPANYTVENLVYLSNTIATIDYGSNDFTIVGNVSLNSNISFSGTGDLMFDASKSAKINAPTAFANASVVFNNTDGKWDIQGDFEANSIELRAGSLNIDGGNVQLGNLLATSGLTKTLSFSSATIEISGNVEIDDETTFLDTDSEFNFNSASSILGTGLEIAGVVNSAISLNVNGVSKIEDLSVSGDLSILSNIEVSNITLAAGSNIEISNSNKLTVGEITANSEDGNLIRIFSSGSGEYEMDGHRKVCLEFMSIENIAAVGEATLNVGLTSQLVNSTGWVTQECDAVLFADFTTNYACSNSLVQFTDVSSGAVNSYNWSFGDGNTSDEQNPTNIYATAGTYSVEFIVSDDEQTNTYTFDLIIGENELEENVIITNSTSLISTNSGEAYQWFRDGTQIDGATDRTYVHNNEAGVYTVVVFGTDCNTISSEYELVVAGLNKKSPFTIYPNPGSGFFNLKSDLIRQDLIITITDLNGKVIDGRNINGSGQIDLSSLNQGIYVLSISQKDKFIGNEIIVINK